MEENETFFIRVWKPLPSRRALKTLRGSPKGKAQREQYLVAVGLGRYIWYQSQTPDDVPMRRLPRRGVDTRRCASKDAEPRKGWVQRVPHRLEKGTSASEDAGP